MTWIVNCFGSKRQMKEINRMWGTLWWKIVNIKKKDYLTKNLFLESVLYILLKIKLWLKINKCCTHISASSDYTADVLQIIIYCTVSVMNLCGWKFCSWQRIERVKNLRRVSNQSDIMKHFQVLNVTSCTFIWICLKCLITIWAAFQVFCFFYMFRIFFLKRF